MIEITLYKFGKRPNSSLRPTNNDPHTSYQCVLRSPTSIVSPIIEIEDTKDEDIFEFTYAYIPVFNRYYFISNIISHTDIVWIFSLRCDVLASFRTTIMSSSQYVVRSASTYDGDIIDTTYTNKAMPTNSKLFKVTTLTPNVDDIFQYDSKGSFQTLGVRNYFHSVVDQGCFVLGVLGDNTAGVIYYAMDAVTFSQLLTTIFNLVPSNMSDVSSGLANAIYNPMQYITYCKWYPVMPINRGSARVESIYVGSMLVYTSSLGNCYKLDASLKESFAFVITMPTHPDVDGGAHRYFNLSPFRKLNFYSGIFGDIPIDTLKMYGTNNLGVVWDVDYTQGRTVLKLLRNFNILGDWDMLNNETNMLVYEMVCDTGVDVPISSLVVDWKVGAALTGLNWLGEKVGDLFPVKSSNIVSGVVEGFNNLTTPKTFQHPVTKKQAGASAPSNPKPHSAYTPSRFTDSGGGGGHSFGDTGGGGGHSFGTSSTNSVENFVLPTAEVGNTSTDNRNLFDNIADALGSALGQVATKGSTSSFMSYSLLPCVYAWFTYHVEEDNTRFGRPLYQTKVLGDLSGYCLCANATIAHYEDAIIPLDVEQNAIVRLLNTGVFLE